MASSEKSNQELISALVEVSRLYGADPEFVLAGGGNTSAKSGQSLWVKASGVALANITADGFVELKRPALDAILTSDYGSDWTVREERFKQAVLAARVEPEKGQRPSVEAVLHHVMPRKLVVHSHSTVVNIFTCHPDGEALIKELCGDDAIWIADVDPGYVLAQTLRDALLAYARKTGRDCPRAVIMQNHGLVIAGDTVDDIKKHTDWLINALKQRVAKAATATPFGPVTAVDAATKRKLINVIGPVLRGLLATEEALKVVPFEESAEVLSLVAGADGKSVALEGPLTPDQVVYCRALPLWIEVSDEPADVLVGKIRDAVAAYESKAKIKPQVILVKGLGMFTAGDDYASADITRQVYIDAIKVMAGARSLGGIHYLNQRQRDFFENWEVEIYRRKVAKGNARPGRAAGKVCVVTGAAQGFGLEIAQDLAAQGAHVVLTDMNIDGATKAAQAIAAKTGTGRATAQPINVTNAESIDEAVHQVVRTYGGFDVFISNAGVLKAGSVKTQSEKDFDFVTNVNYKGFFLCTQKVAPILALQRKARSDYWSDIIQINSKSGLRGSNKNGAYAGGKFGGIGLVESYAMELVEDGIKVNAICPGNFYDGPLWSDPKNGLFVQYLTTGKVPGAKTIEDVRKFYEAQAPIRRGCTTADVMKAVYYLVDQLYETGQALPVTGGQVMLK